MMRQVLLLRPLNERLNGHSSLSRGSGALSRNLRISSEETLLLMSDAIKSERKCLSEEKIILSSSLPPQFDVSDSEWVSVATCAQKTISLVDLLGCVLTGQRKERGKKCFPLLCSEQLNRPVFVSV